ncbi:hypothetical protein Hdeb2414_s0019g00541581 [Helianthus debilis subsp. tardiflorus]
MKKADKGLGFRWRRAKTRWRYGRDQIRFSDCTKQQKSVVFQAVTRRRYDGTAISIEEIEQQVLATEASNFNLSWLRAHLNVIHKRKEASKKCSLLMETKVNTVLVKKAAQVDLRERSMEFKAAQERFE